MFCEWSFFLLAHLDEPFKGFDELGVFGVGIQDDSKIFFFCISFCLSLSHCLLSIYACSLWCSI